MIKERIIEEMAKLEGCTKCGCGNEWRDPLGYPLICLPDYLEDHNAVQRVIDGLDSGQLKEYVEALGTAGDNGDDDEMVMFVFKATCLQKCEAILKALGKWKES